MVAVDTFPTNSATRRRGLRTLLVSLVIFCFVGLLAAEAFHHHQERTQDNHCLLCQAAAHQPFKATPPPAAVIAVWVVLLYQLILHTGILVGQHLDCVPPAQHLPFPSSPSSLPGLKLAPD